MKNYGKEKNRFWKLFLKNDSKAVTSGENLTEESICLSCDPDQDADKSKFTPRHPLNDDVFEKPINQSEGCKKWQNKLKRGRIPSDNSTKPSRLIILRIRDCINTQERLLGNLGDFWGVTARLHVASEKSSDTEVEQQVKRLSLDPASSSCLSPWLLPYKRMLCFSITVKGLFWQDGDYYTLKLPNTLLYWILLGFLHSFSYLY